MIDYQELINNLEPKRVKNLLLKLGAEQVIEKDNCLITNTICHNIEGGSLKLYYYFDRHLFVCYSGGCGTMNIFTFLKTYYETRGIEWDWYNDIFLVVQNCAPSKEFEDFGVEKIEKIGTYHSGHRRDISLPTYSAGVLDVFQKVYPAQWVEEGISPKTMDKFNILFSSSQNKIIIPHYDINGHLIGIRGRALNEWEIENLGKYMPVQIEKEWYTHKLSLNLYGLNKTKEAIKKNGYVFVFEGEKSVLIMDGFDMPNCSVAVCGSQFNKFQLQLLLRECQPKEVVLCFDNEELPHQDTYYNKLRKICLKYNQYADFSFIYDDMGLTQLKDSPCDRGQEIFMKLLEKRRKVK